MNPEEILKSELRTAENLDQFMEICKKHYDFKNTKLGLINRPMLITGITAAIRMSGAKPFKNK